MCGEASYRSKRLTLAERGRNIDIFKINDDDDDDDDDDACVCCSNHCKFSTIHFSEHENKII